VKKEAPRSQRGPDERIWHGGGRREVSSRRSNLDPYRQVRAGLPYPSLNTAVVLPVPAAWRGLPRARTKENILASRDSEDYSARSNAASAKRHLKVRAQTPHTASCAWAAGVSPLKGSRQ
jgi:hypothetical protein